VIKKAAEEPGNVRKVFACITGTGSSPFLPIDLPGELFMNLLSLKLSTAHNHQSNRTVLHLLLTHLPFPEDVPEDVSFSSSILNMPLSNTVQTSVY
jgi:hypothetical protein